MLLSPLLTFALLGPPAELEAPPASRPRVGALSVAGATTAGAGLGALVAGAVMLARGPRITLGTHMINPRRRGAALVGVGVVGLSMGLSLLALELGVLERQAATRRLALGFELGPAGGGLWLGGSF